MNIEPKMEGRFKIGARAYFQPNLQLVDARTQTTDPSIAAPCEIVGVGFSAGKVFYDIEVVYMDGEERSTECRLPLYRVMSDMIAEGCD